MKQVLEIVILSLLSSSIYAADVRIIEIEYADSQPMILIEGKITKGDTEKVKKLSKKLLETDPNFRLEILINSIGGDVREAIELGRFLRSMLANVSTSGRWVYDSTSKEGKEQMKLSDRDKSGPKIYRYRTIFKIKNEPLENNEITKCYSACVLILVAGVNRSYTDTIDTRYVIGPKQSKTYPVIGLHRPYYSKDIFSKMSVVEAEKHYKMLETITTEYLEEMGASQLLVEKMLRTKSTAMEEVDMYKFRKYLPFVAPFFEEWKIAKCGDLSTNNGLTNKELVELENLKKEFKRVTPLPNFNNTESVVDYMAKNEKFKIGNGKTIGYYTDKIKSSNGSIHKCVDKLIREHQSKMLKDLKI